MGALARGPILLDLAEQLSAFGSPIVDERVHVPLETLDRLFHLAVPVLGALEARFEVEELLVGSLVPVDDNTPYTLHGLVLALLASYALVLEKTVEGDGQHLHQGGLLMIRLDEPILERPVLLELGLEQLLLVVGDRLLVEDEDL